MIHFKKPLLLALLAFVIFISSCSKPGNGTQYIPKDATIVLTVNGNKIGKKIAWASLWSGDLFKDMKLDSAENMGIDMMNTFYAYALPDQRLPASTKLVMIIPLSNTKDWQQFLKKKFSNVTTQDEGGITISSLQDNMVEGRKGNTAIMVMALSSGVSEEATGWLKDEVKKAFTLKKEDNIGNNEKFKELVGKNYDAGIWINQERMSQSIPGTNMGAGGILAGQQRFAKDAYVIGGLNFEKGSIHAEATYYTNPTMSGILQKLTPEKYDDDLLKRLPGGQLAGVLSYHFNPAGISAMIDTMGYSGMINSQLQEQGLTIDGILSAFTGDFAAGISDIKMVTHSYSNEYYGTDNDMQNYTYDEPDGNWLISFKIKDEAALDKLIQLGLQNEILSVKGDHLFLANGVYVSTKDGYGVISSKQETIQSFFASAGNVPALIPSEVKSNPLGIYVDYKQLAPFFKPSDHALPKEKEAMSAAQNFVDNITMYSTRFSSNHSDLKLEATFKNKEENSLLQIIKLVVLFTDAQKESDQVATN